jgi:bifunctional non-homologous end joining protein LigD
MRHTSTVTGIPDWIAPQLTKLVDVVPEGDQWAHEIKLDGYRMHGRLDRGQVKLLTRTGLDWTEKYPTTAKALRAVSSASIYRWRAVRCRREWRHVIWTYAGCHG